QFRLGVFALAHALQRLFDACFSAPAARSAAALGVRPVSDFSFVFLLPSFAGCVAMCSSTWHCAFFPFGVGFFYKHCS
ncbi:hypothetical protein U1Q18_015040, partial [Sarracenia purpurea var. burkii]